MVRVPDLIPPKELLDQIQGVEAGLRQRKRLGALGWLGVVVAALQISVSLINSGYLQNLQKFNWAGLTHQLPVLIAIPIATLSIVAISWSRFWLQQSREAFRFTFDVAEFQPADGQKKVEWMAELRYALTRRLSERIVRLYHLDEAKLPKADPQAKGDVVFESHIHISAVYAVLELEDGNREIEVTPWIRIGPPGKPETIARTARLSLKKTGSTRDTAEQVERVLEFLYFNVATQIYDQIRLDVHRKIALLPSKRFRATAYYFEAVDHARSNTADAYEEARRLYEESLKLFDPEWRPLSVDLVPRLGQRIHSWYAEHMRLWIAQATHLWPRLGGHDVLVARAEIGYANVVIFRAVLSALVGQRPNPVLEARAVSERAVTRLEALADDVPGRRDALFSGYVTSAIVHCNLENRALAEAALWNAARTRPFQTNQLDTIQSRQSARYHFASGLLADHPLSRLDSFRVAVDLDPDFEVALYRLAVDTEVLWRRRPTLEKSVAEGVIKLYRKVLDLNPGNLGAWSNIGYIRWLLGQCDEAAEAFENGLRFRDVRSDTEVAELEYGLARIYAETAPKSSSPSPQEMAYAAYIDSMASQLNSVKPRRLSFHDYYFFPISGGMLGRFTEYRDKVRLNLGLKDTPTGDRVTDAVYAFVLNDYGEACFTHYLTFASDESLENARAAFSLAIECNDDFLFPHYNLAKMQDESADHVGRLLRLRPGWPDAEKLDIEARLAEVRQHQTGTRDAERRALDARMVSTRLTLRTTDLVLSSYDEDTQARIEALRAESETAKKTVEELNEDVAARKKNLAALKTTIFSDLQQRLGLSLNAYFRRALPHPWLWSEDGIDPVAIRGRGFRDRLRWGREFSDSQVSSLKLLAQVLAVLDESPTGIGLLKLMRAIAWEEEFTLLNVLRDVDPKNSEEYTEVIRQTIESWVSDEAPFWALTWVDTNSFGDLARSELFVRIASRDDFARNHDEWKPLMQWIGERLSQLGTQNAAAGEWPLAQRCHDGAIRMFDSCADVRAAQSRLDYVKVRLRSELTRMSGSTPGGEPLEADEAFRDMALQGSRDVPRWATDLVEELEADIKTPAARRLLVSWFEALRAHEARPNFTQAIWRLISLRQPDMAWGVPRLTLSLNPFWFPQNADSALAKWLMGQRLPQLRAALLEQTGVELPGVRLRREQALGVREVEVLVDDTVQLRSTVYPDLVFCPDVARVAALKIPSTASAEVGGISGAWVSAADIPANAKDDLAVWDVPEVMARQLEAVAVTNLYRFVQDLALDAQLAQQGGQEFAKLLNSKGADDVRMELSRLMTETVRSTGRAPKVADVGRLIARRRAKGWPIGRVLDMLEKSVDGSTGGNRVKLEPDVLEKIRAFVVADGDSDGVLIVPKDRLAQLVGLLAAIVADQNGSGPVVVETTDPGLRTGLSALLERVNSKARVRVRRPS